MKKYFIQSFRNFRAILLRKYASPVRPVFVLQMGRVGSTSVMVALQSAYQELGLNIPIYHSHYIANYDLIVRRLENDLDDISGAQHDIEMVDKKNRALLLSYLEKQQPIRIVSLVRDPVARNVSAFFFVFSTFVSDWKTREANNLLDAVQLHRIIEEKKGFIQTALGWFDEQLNDGLGINIYSVPFDKARGWQVYKKHNIELLILRMEDFYRTGEASLKRFLNLPNLTLPRVNTGEEREAYELYRRFLTTPLSQEYLDINYKSLLARHFYTNDEIESFRNYWRNLKP